MTKADIIINLQKIIGESKVSKSECDRIWSALLEVISEEVKAGGEIKFGSLFKVFKKHKNERKVRNPKTGVSFTKAAKDELACKVMKEGKNLFEK